MVTADGTFTIDTYTKKKKESKHNTKSSHQITRERKKKERENTYKNKSKTINNPAISIYISKITLSVNRLNASTKKQTLAEWIPKQDPYIYMLSTEDPLQITESEGMEKGIPHK